ncbi:zonular occludens toxin domain-containing protein, partial [Escherichia coli]
MAVSLYMGVMGSGKTYEVVYSVIIPAVSAGRRVITNIKGINEEKIHEYCRSKFKTKQPGRVVFASTDEILKDDFFPFYSDDESSEQKAAFCEYGDLICLDELWSIWPSDSKLSEAHKRFISMHRHMTHAVSGVSCDLVIINQGVDGVPRYLKERIESTYRMTKLKSLGLSKSYRVDVFSGAKVFKNNKVSTRNYQYKKAVFELYKSYETTNGMEATTDSRQNVFSSAFLWVKIAFLLFIVLASIYSIRT